MRHVHPSPSRWRCVWELMGYRGEAAGAGVEFCRISGETKWFSQGDTERMWQGWQMNAATLMLCFNFIVHPSCLLLPTSLQIHAPLMQSELRQVEIDKLGLLGFQHGTTRLRCQLLYQEVRAACSCCKGLSRKKNLNSPWEQWK